MNASGRGEKPRHDRTMLPKGREAGPTDPAGARHMVRARPLVTGQYAQAGDGAGRHAANAGRRRAAMVHVEGGRQPGVAYVAIVLFALLVAAMLIPGYTMGF
jgi:hypothetical protein